MSLNRRIPRFIISLVAFMSIFSTIFLLAAPPASAAGAGPDTPKAYKSVSGDGSANPLDNEFYCKFRNSAEVLCWRSAPTDVNSNDGKENEKAYHFDPKLSSAAGHDVFRPDGNNASDYGFLHFPNSASGDYATGQVSKSKVDGSSGVEDNDVDTGSFNVSADKGVCSVEGAKDGKNNTCVVGNTRVSGPGIGATVTSNYKSGYTAYKEQANLKCDAGALDFILCPIQSLLTKAVNSMTKIIVENLAVPTGSFFTSTEIKDAFNRVLGIANGAFALIFLIVIFGNTLSLGIDSYTIKKALPRLVIAVLLAQFSYFIAGAVIETGNVLGHAIPQTIFNLDSATIQAFQGGSFSALASILFSIVFLILAFVAVLVGVVVLALRQIILIGLIILGPIAFAAWVLPGTQKGFKFWWENLIKLSLMFPIISTILVGSLFLSRLIGGGDEGSEIVRMGAQLLPIIALLYLPKTFKWSGQLMSGTAGKISGAGSGFAKKQTVGRAKDAYSKPGGLKDKAVSSGITPSFGGKRLEKLGAAEANVQKRAEAGASTAARLVGAMDGGKDGGTPEQQRAYDAKQDAVKKYAKQLSTPEAQGKFAASLAKSGDRTSAQTVRSQMSDAAWKAGVAANYGDYDKAPDLRKTAAEWAEADIPPTAPGLPPTLKGSHKFVNDLNAESFVSTSGPTQKTLTSPDLLQHFKPETLKRLGDQGVRSRLGTDTVSNLQAHEAQLASLGARNAEQQAQYDALQWLHS